WAIHVDTMFFSLLTGIIFIALFRAAARRATAGVPSGLQNQVDVLVEFIQRIVRDTSHDRNPIIGLLALPIFVWVFLMNSLKWLAVDLVPGTAHTLWLNYWKTVPTTEPNGTFGLSIGVFIQMIYHSFKVKGVGGITKE